MQHVSRQQKCSTVGRETQPRELVPLGSHVSRKVGVEEQATPPDVLKARQEQLHMDQSLDRHPRVANPASRWLQSRHHHYHHRSCAVFAPAAEKLAVEMELQLPWAHLHKLQDFAGLVGPNLVGLAGSNLVGLVGSNLVGLAGPNLVGLVGPNFAGLVGPNLVGLVGLVCLVGLVGPNLVGSNLVGLVSPNLLGSNLVGLAGPNLVGLVGPNLVGLVGLVGPNLVGSNLVGLAGPNLVGLVRLLGLVGLVGSSSSPMWTSCLAGVALISLGHSCFESIEQAKLIRTQTRTVKESEFRLETSSLSPFETCSFHGLIRNLTAIHHNLPRNRSS